MAIPKRMVSGDFSRYADHLEVEFVSNCGHFVEEEQPELVTRRTLDFFSAAA
jgi:pimeloyl-ACP methyl ester carboxylesterase